MKDSTTFRSYHEFEKLFGIKSNFLAFQGLLSALRSLKLLNRDCSLIRKLNKKCEHFHEQFLKTEKANKVVYERLVRIKKQRPTETTKLITFQFKLLHWRLTTNDFLKKIGVKNNDRCTFCEVELENLTHLFWFCSITSSFWQKFKQWLIKEKNFATMQDTDLTFSIIIGLRPNSFKTEKIHLSFLVARYFIWVFRVRDRAPSLECVSSLVTSFDVSYIVSCDSFHSLLSFDIKKPSVS